MARPVDDDGTVRRPIHDDEPVIDETVVRALLAEQCPPGWADAPLVELAGSDDDTGTDNSLWRVRLDAARNDVVVRLPRRPGAAAGVAHETALLRDLADVWSLAEVAVPTVVHAGEPSSVFAHAWTVLGWLDGVDAWTARARIDPTSHVLAESLATVVRAVAALPVSLPLRRRRHGMRGGPIAGVVERIDGWLGDPQWRADELLDVAAIRSIVAHHGDARDIEPGDLRVVHGDLIPGNVLVATAASGTTSAGTTSAGTTSSGTAEPVADDRAGAHRPGSPAVCAVIDWGGAGIGDPAQDLAPAWSLLDGSARDVFRRAVGADDATWSRGVLTELEHAIGGVLYYVPRRHPLGDVMSRTLARILADQR